MVQEVSGSGARFVEPDGNSGHRLNAKGDDLLILKQGPDQEGEAQSLAKCHAKRPEWGLLPQLRGRAICFDRPG